MRLASKPAPDCECGIRCPQVPHAWVCTPLLHEPGQHLCHCAQSMAGSGFLTVARRRVQASRVADAALIPTPQIVSRAQSANIFRWLLVIGFFPFLFSVCRSFQTIARNITSNAKRTPKPTHAARVELAPTGPTRLNPPAYENLITPTDRRFAFFDSTHRQPQADSAALP